MIPRFLRILFDLLDTHHAFDRLSDPAAQDRARAAALQAYSALRVSDAHANHDLSRTNYLLLRGGVNSPAYRIRKSVEEYLQRYAPLLGWRMLYSRVSFSDQRYSEVVAKDVMQGRILITASGLVVFVAMLVSLAMLYLEPKL